MSQRPKALHELQAVAALGQMGLIQHFESCFKRHGIHTAQVLLTHEDLSNRQRYLNARATLSTLLDFGAVPVINENDTVVTEEIRFGDNDTLAALVANLIDADTLDKSAYVIASLDDHLVNSINDKLYVRKLDTSSGSGRYQIYRAKARRDGCPGDHASGEEHESSEEPEQAAEQEREHEQVGRRRG